MKLSRKGTVITVNGDTLVKSWPWCNAPGKYFSNQYGEYFSSLPEYWEFRGKIYYAKRVIGPKIEGLDMHTVLFEWVVSQYRNTPVVVLTDVNVSEKSLAFWMKLPHEHIRNMTKDVVVLRCSSRSEVIDLIESIPSELARAQGFANSKEVASNEKE